MTAATELRIALTVADYRQCLSFYRNVIGLPLLQEWPSAEGRGALPGARADAREGHQRAPRRAGRTSPDAVQVARLIPKALADAAQRA